MFVVRGLLLTSALSSCPSLVVGSPCPFGSLPFFDCDFNPGAIGVKACWPGVNWGQAANPNNYDCQVPSPSNGCLLQAQANLTWKWISPSVTCCNCFQKKFSHGGFCEADSLPQDACNFQSTSGFNSCYPAANTGEAARPSNNECQVPTPANGCKLVVNTFTKVYSWQSTQFGVQCCNCFLRRGANSGFGLSQIDASASMLQDSVELPKRVSDEASMLQVARASSRESYSPAGGASSPCISSSLPYFDCDFTPGASGSSACWPGVNTGQAASPYNSVCSVPYPENGCTLQAQSDYTWQWKSPSVTCCNCFQKKNTGSACPAGSLPQWSCDFHSDFGPNTCFPAVNTGETARPNDGECEVPRPSNGCLLQADPITKVYSWQSSRSGVTCCNCFLTRDSVNQSPYLAQMDEASMLQLPAEPSNAEL